MGASNLTQMAVRGGKGGVDANGRGDKFILEIASEFEGHELAEITQKLFAPDFAQDRSLSGSDANRGHSGLA